MSTPSSSPQANEHNALTQLRETLVFSDLSPDELDALMRDIYANGIPAEVDDALQIRGRLRTALDQADKNCKARLQTGAQLQGEIGRGLELESNEADSAADGFKEEQEQVVANMEVDVTAAVDDGRKKLSGLDKAEEQRSQEGDAAAIEQIKKSLKPEKGEQQ